MLEAVSDSSTTSLVVQGVIGAVTTALGFLLKSAISEQGKKVDGLKTEIVEVSKGLDRIAESVSTHSTAIALLNQTTARLEAEVSANRERLHNLKDAWTPTLARATAVGERLESLEHTIERIEHSIQRIKEGGT